MNITDKELYDKGFMKYNRTPYQRDGVICNFQKCYRDPEKGNRLFFLDVHKWDFSSERIPDIYTYEITAQLYKKGNHDFFDITFGADFTVEDAEEFIYKLFEYGMIEPYEKD